MAGKRKKKKINNKKWGEEILNQPSQKNRKRESMSGWVENGNKNKKKEKKKEKRDEMVANGEGYGRREKKWVEVIRE